MKPTNPLLYSTDKLEYKLAYQQTTVQRPTNYNC